jgi:hypothetical protein
MIKTLITLVIAGLGFIIAVDAQAGGYAPDPRVCGAQPGYIPEGVNVRCICGSGNAGGWGPSNPCGWIFESK